MGIFIVAFAALILFCLWTVAAFFILTLLRLPIWARLIGAPGIVLSAYLIVSWVLHLMKSNPKIFPETVIIFFQISGLGAAIFGIPILGIIGVFGWKLRNKWSAIENH